MESFLRRTHRIQVHRVAVPAAGRAAFRSLATVVILAAWPPVEVGHLMAAEVAWVSGDQQSLIELFAGHTTFTIVQYRQCSGCILSCISIIIEHTVCRLLLLDSLGSLALDRILTAS